MQHSYGKPAIEGHIDTTIAVPLPIRLRRGRGQLQGATIVSMGIDYLPKGDNLCYGANRASVYTMIAVPVPTSIHIRLWARATVVLA